MRGGEEREGKRGKKERKWRVRGEGEEKVGGMNGEKRAKQNERVLIIAAPVIIYSLNMYIYLQDTPYKIICSNMFMVCNLVGKRIYYHRYHNWL